jgi:hypothetical protein
MRKLLPALIAGLVLFPTGVARAQQGEARAIIERAVKAMGGLENLTKLKAAHSKSRGIYPMDGEAFTTEAFSESPNRIKLMWRSSDRATPMLRTLVITGEKGWMVSNGFLTDLDEEIMATMRKARYADRVGGLTVLLQEEGFTLMPLGATKVKDKAAVGVKVQSAGHQDISLYFDIETGLLMKEARMVTDLAQRKEVLQEMYFSDYRRFDPAGPEQQLLQAARRPLDGPGLLQFLSERTPPEQLRGRVKELVARFGDPSYRVREQSTAEVKKLGLPAAPLLRAALADADREVGRRARLCLDHLADHPDTALIRAAVRLIALRRPTGAAGVLLTYLPWAPDEATAKEVKEALAAVALLDGQPNSVLANALKDADPVRRAAAAAVLGKDGGAYAKQGWRRVAFQGLLLSNRVLAYREGRLHMDLTTYERHFYNRLDDSIFARPE